MNYNWLLSEPFIAFLFILVLGIVLWHKRDKLAIQKILYPVFYMVLYRTKWGIQKMDDIAKKHPKSLKYISLTGMYIGFVGMFLTVVFLLYTIFKIFMGSTEAAVGIAQPFVKTGFGSPFIYIPLIYFIIAIFIIAVSHEACHGIIARLYKVKIKSSGFAFFSIFIPVIPAAFVEPEEKQVKKLKTVEQLSIFAAGPFANICLAIISLLLLISINPGINRITAEEVIIINYTPNNNITFPAEKANVTLNDKIIGIDSYEITTLKSFMDTMESTKPNQIIQLHTNSTTYNITLTKAPELDSGYLGVMVTANRYIKPNFKNNWGWTLPIINWILGLLVILFVFNLGVGLINLAPIGPLDGGRMVLTLLMTRYNKEKATLIWGKISMATLLLLLAVIFLPFILRFFI
jgi:membrane-associated protease RseP (regulator of RpoE activity)